MPPYPPGQGGGFGLLMDLMDLLQGFLHVEFAVLPHG